MSLDLDFAWERDARGYVLSPDDPVVFKTVRQERHFREWFGDIPLPPGKKIVRSGGKLVPCYPFKNTDCLHRTFLVRAKHEKGLLSFVQDFGPLTAEGNTRLGESAALNLRAAAQMRGLLTKFARDKVAFANFLVEIELRLSNVDITLARDPVTDNFHLKYTPPDLLNALWLELAQSLTGAATLKLCGYCGEPFPAGPGTRRLDAKFCSPEHQRAFNQLKRSKERAEHA